MDKVHLQMLAHLQLRREVEEEEVGPNVTSFSPERTTSKLVCLPVCHSNKVRLVLGSNECSCRSNVAEYS